MKWYEWEEIDPKTGNIARFDARYKLPIYDGDSPEEIERVKKWWENLCKEHNYTGIGSVI